MNFKIYTLGCKVNTYETNVISEQLKKAGYKEVKNNEDISIINTCTVTNTADNKSNKIIHRVIKENANRMIIVVGCMSQIRYEELSKIPEISIILGNKYKSKLVEFIDEFKKNGKQIIHIEDIMDTKFETMKLNNFNRTRAFVKIQDGCDNFCSYCIIPYSRGNVRSKDPLDVIDEVKTLVKMGHHEVVLTGIHTGHYGAEFNNYCFADLLNALIQIPGLERLRISSIEMNEITDDVLELMKQSNILVNHMHIPLQSGCDKILKDMNRKYNIEEFEQKLNDIRKIRPNISISTDLIVGFPGETEEDFVDTCETLKRLNFSKVHVFPYSERKGTKASLMKDMNGTIKKERVRKVIEISNELEQAYMEKFINKDIEFIPEVEKNGYLIGHTENYLLVKAKGDISKLNQTVPLLLEKVEYPYVVGSIKDRVSC